MRKVIEKCTRRRIVSCIISLCMLLSMFWVSPVFTQASSRIIPVLNADFELPLDNGAIQGWTQIMGVGKNGSISKDLITVKSGEASLKITDNDTLSNFAVESTKYEVIPSSNYSVTTDVYLKSGVIQLQLRFYDSNNTLVSGGIFVNDPNYTSQTLGQWQNLSLSAKAPENAKYISIVAVSGKGGKGVIYCDNFKLIEIGEELPPPQPSLKRHVANGGFEEPVVGTKIPGWNVIKGKPVISSAMAFSGENSLYVSHVSTEGTGVTIESDLIDVEEGEPYLLTTNVLVETRGMLGLYVYIYDEAGNIVKSADAKDYHAYVGVTTPLNEWVSTENAFTVQPGGKKLKISIITSYKRTDKFYIDDITVIKAVKNGDFEQASINGSIPGWKKYNEATDGSKFGVTDSVYTSGSKSLYLETESGKYLNVISDLIDVEPGETYTALAKNFIDYGSADMYVRFFDSSDKYIGQQAWSIRNDITNSWFTNSVKFIVPENASKAGVMFAGSATKTFKYFVDDVKILKGDHVVKVEITPENSITKIGQDLGPQIRKATIMRGDIGKDGTGRDVIYAVVAGAPSVFTIIDIETELVVKSIPMADTSGAWSVKVSTDGSVYLGAYNLGLLYRYMPETGELKNLGHPLATKDSVLYPMDSGKDGKMYGGNYPSGSLYEYDPATNKFTDYGTMAFSNSGERWTRVTVYDAENNKSYSGVGNQARLVEYDFATGIKRDLLPAQYSDIIAVYDLNLAGGKLFAKKEANNANEMFVIDIESGNLVEVTNADTGEMIYDIPMFSRGVSSKLPIANKIYYAAAAGALYEYDLDTDTIKSLGVSIDGAAIGYGFVELKEEGFPGYSLVGLSGNNGKMYKYNLQTGNVKIKDLSIPAEPVNIHDIVKGPDGRIYTSGYLQGNMGVHVPTTGESYYMNGIGQGEGLTVINNKIYIGAYPDAKIYEYDLDKPWNRDNSDKLNPVSLFSLYDNADIPGYTFQDRPFGMAGSEDMNKLFVGTVPKNGLLGGALAVYDLTTREYPDVYWNIVPDQSVLSLAYKDGMVYGGTSIHGGQGAETKATEAVLFVFDVAKGEKVFETIPVPGKTAITSVHVGPDGNIWGLANGALFVFDQIEQKVIYFKDEFPDAAGRWIDGSMETGTDGNIYATVGGRFFKVDAATKVVTILATQARKLAQDDFGNFYFFTVPEGPNLYKYSDPNLVLKLTGAELSSGKTEFLVGETLKTTLKGALEKDRTTYEMTGAVVNYSISDPAVVEFINNSLVAKKPGVVQISATVTLNGVTVETNSITVEIFSNTVYGNGTILVNSANITLIDGKVSAEVDKDTITRAISKTLLSEKKEFTIIIPEVKDAELINTILSAESLDEAKDYGIERISVANSMGEISIIPYALKNSVMKDAKTIQIVISMVDKDILPAKIMQEIGDKAVYDFSIYADDEVVKNFTGQKAIEITLPYNLAQEEDPNKIVINYISDNGDLKEEKHCTYNESKRTVTFITNRLYQYVVK